MRVCEVEDCNEKHQAKGYCMRHYQRLFRRQESLGGYAPRDDPEKRFWVQVKRKTLSECWEWQGQTNKDYGVLTVNGTRQLAHRFSFFLHNGRWPKQMVLHSCDNPGCVNPNHLREGTAKDNALDRQSRLRSPRGENRPFAKLTEDAVIKMREMRANGETLATIGKRFGVSGPSAWHAINRKTWSWV